MSIYDISTLYTTLPHQLITDKLIDLILDVCSGKCPIFALQRGKCFFFVLFCVFFFLFFFFFFLGGGGGRVSLLMHTRITIYGLVKKSVMSLSLE